MNLFQSDHIAIGALVVAAFSLLIAWRSHALAKRAFKLAEAEHEERYLSVKTYLINAYKQRIKGVEYCLFAVSYTNQASVANSITTVDLEVEYTDPNGLVSKIKLKPAKELNTISVPRRIEEKETVSGRFAFEIPKNDKLEMNIDCYRVHAHLASGEVATVRSYLVNRIEVDTNSED
jgi:hypothetical protein